MSVEWHASVSPPPAVECLDLRLRHEWVQQLLHMLPKDYRTPDRVPTLMHWAVRVHALECRVEGVGVFDAYREQEGWSERLRFCCVSPPPMAGSG